MMLLRLHDELLKASVGPMLQRQFGSRGSFDRRDDFYVLTAVLVTFAHDRRKKVSVEEITDRVADFTALRGDTHEGGRISIGRMLSKIGVGRTHTNKRNEVVLDPVNLNAIHQAAWLKGALQMKNLSADCLYCDWLAGKDGLGNDNSEGCEGSGEKATEPN